MALRHSALKGDHFIEEEKKESPSYSEKIAKKKNGKEEERTGLVLKP